MPGAALARPHIGRRAAELHKLPAKGWIFDETTWNACNLESQRVDLATAPSRSAVNLLSALKKDEKLRRAFGGTFLKRRISRPYD